MVKIKTINSGGFGVVSLYASNGIHYAVKQLINAWDPRNWKMFIREIDIIRNLNHPNIVSINNYDKSQQNAYYIMKYYPEGSLRNKMLNLQREKKWMTEKSASAMTLVMAKALSYAHSRGVIHRDFKPENILFDKGNPLIADWGIGKFVHRQSKVHNYKCGGTPPYCAPEQWNFGKSDARSDIYSLGIVYRELISGRVDGNVNDFRIRSIIDKMTAFHPDFRYQSMDEVIKDLGSLYTYSENATNDFWGGFGKVLLVVGGVVLFVAILNAILD